MVVQMSRDGIIWGDMPDAKCRILDITAMTQYTAEGRRDSLREILEKISDILG